MPWLWLYRRPEQLPRLSAEERAIIPNGVQDAESPGAERAADRAGAAAPRWTESLKRRETWLLLFSRVLTDPVWSGPFWNAFRNNSIFFAIHMVVQTSIGLALAALLSLPRLRGAGIYRTLLGQTSRRSSTT